MKILYSPIFMIVCALFLVSCSWGNVSSSWTTSLEQSSAIKIIDISPLEKTKVFSPVTVSYDISDKKLHIWETIISEGFPKSLSEIIAPTGEITYINSSVTTYYFFVTKKAKQDIFSYYRSLGVKLWWKEIKDATNTDENRIFFDGWKKDQMPSVEKITITTNTSLPENLAPIKLSWLYVEVTKEIQ